MQDIGIPATYSIVAGGINLTALYSFSIPQLATMGTGVEELNQKLAAEEISKEEYDQNIENLR